MRMRIKDIDRGRYAITVSDIFAYLKSRGESIIAIQNGSTHYRGHNCSTVITDRSRYAVWEDTRKHYM